MPATRWPCSADQPDHASGPATTIPAGQRASEASLRRRLEVALDHNRRLAQDNERLRRQLAVALGERRAARSRGWPALSLLDTRPWHAGQELTMHLQSGPGVELEVKLERSDATSPAWLHRINRPHGQRALGLAGHEAERRGAYVMIAAMASIEELLHRRTDLSTFLVHFTRDSDDESASASDNLLNILLTRRIEARSALGMAKDLADRFEEVADIQRVVCFTEGVRDAPCAGDVGLDRAANT